MKQRARNLLLLEAFRHLHPLTFGLSSCLFNPDGLEAIFNQVKERWCHFRARIVFVGALPLSVSTDALLDQDDLISDGFVSLYLQLRVMVVLKNIYQQN